MRTLLTQFFALLPLMSQTLLGRGVDQNFAGGLVAEVRSSYQSKEEREEMRKWGSDENLGKTSIFVKDFFFPEFANRYRTNSIMRTKLEPECLNKARAST